MKNLIKPIVLFVASIFAYINVYGQIDTILRDKINQMAKKDQDWMMNPPKNANGNDYFFKRMEEIYRENYEDAKVIFSKFGFPGYNKVGKDGSDKFWLVVQHLNKWPDFQTLVLKKMAAEVKRKNASADKYAYLLDRINLNSGELQIYGTQIWYDIRYHRTFPYPVVDIKRVNKRRKAVGLEALEVYLNTTTESHFALRDSINLRSGVKKPWLYKVPSHMFGKY
ncbi:DUF6624 domain-containing protein [Sphingobacterium thalpophilum]|uniref:Uncharacterized protein n=1 Tax=Sphingobacterium thalpophilum TaxID=259 RepID=A0A4U9UWJ5_9SPHI|nr:DUF6624 domain-containing protein [Sphingobacterium thalpophilum]VTR36662.1 Uncharacterised protein [Sphingobacterium thalpophilum]